MDPGNVMSGYYRHRCIRNRRPAQHIRRRTREEAEQSLRLADGLWRNHPSDGGPGRADCWKAGPENVGVHRRGYITFHPEVRCSVGFGRVRPRTSSATTRSGGGDIMETWRLIKFFSELTGRLRGDAGSI